MQTIPPQQVIERLWPSLTANPELLFHQIDLNRNAGLFIQMPDGAYRAASFLDGRTFTPQTVGSWVPLARIKDSVLHADGHQAPLHFIFHMGHTGSTLLSRLLDETGMVHPLREPLLLRELAVLLDKREDPASLVPPEETDAYLEIALRLWSRCAAPGHSAILKATSTASRAGPALMKARPAARAVYLSLAPEPYLAAIMAGQSSFMDIRGHAEERMRRLVSCLGGAPKPLHAMGFGEMVAAAWAAEALTRERLKKETGGRLLALDFDDVLTDLPGTLRSVLHHFALPNDPDTVQRLLQSPALGQYAKAPEHAYSADMRRRLIEESRQRNSDEIARGMAFLSDLAGRHETVAAVMP